MPHDHTIIHLFFGGYIGSLIPYCSLFHSLAFSSSSAANVSIFSLFKNAHFVAYLKEREVNAD